MTPPVLIIAGGAVIAVGGIVAFHQVGIYDSWSTLNALEWPVITSC